jgi:hypothetical protein
MGKVRRAVTTKQLLCHEDTSLPRLFLFYPQFSIVDNGHVWMLVTCHINRLCGETPTDLRMGVPAPTTNFVGLSVTLNETKRKAAINFRYKSCRDPRELEDWLEAQLQRFVMLGINADSYNVVVWVTPQFSGPLNIWWLNRKEQTTIPDSFDTLVEEIRMTSMLPRHPRRCNYRLAWIYARQFELRGLHSVVRRRFTEVPTTFFR